MTIATLAPARPKPQPPRRSREPAPRHTTEHIEGRYRPIPARTLAMAAWLYREGHITLRALRCYFAACEMAERRRYAKTREAKKHQRFTLEELSRLVGGRGSASAQRELAKDVRRLAEVGLVTIAPNAITFAKSTDTPAVGEGSAEAFSAFMEAFSCLSRPVPVPRRLLRALAAGFRRTDTFYVIGALLRSVFWKKQEGHITIDGRMKTSWVAQTFGISLRGAKEARAHLIEIGWLKPLASAHWLERKYGAHAAINIHWTPANDGGAEPSTDAPTDLSPETVDNPVEHTKGPELGSAPQTPESEGQSAPLWLDKKTPLKRDLNTRKLGATAPDPSGASNAKDSDQTHRGASNDRNSKRRAPTIRDVQVHDLKDPEALQELYRQAIAAGIACSSGAGELDFFALASRALTRGRRPGALFISNLKRGRSHFITTADEEAGRRMLSELRDGPVIRSSVYAKTPKRTLSEDQTFVELCIRSAKRHRKLQPYDLARHAKGWTRKQWDCAEASYQQAQAAQWCTDEEMYG